MHKVLLLRKYEEKDLLDFDRILCFKYNKKVNMITYSSTNVTIYNHSDYNVLLVARGGELEVAVRSMKLDTSKLFVYMYNTDKKYIEDIKKIYPKITVITSEDTPKVLLEITEVGFKWKNYDNISLPKPNKDPKGNKPTAG